MSEPILVVDDNPVNRDLMRSLLEAGGLRSIDAACGEQALRLARAERPALIITDVLMAGMNGFELARSLRDDAELSHLPLLFWTAHYDRDEVHGLAAALDVAGVLPKPGDATAILSKVRELLASDAPAGRTPAAEELDRQQMRVLNDKLVEKADELERTQGALRDSEDRFRMLISNIPGAVYSRGLDADMTIELISDGIEDITGYAAAELIHNGARSFASIVHAEDRLRIAGEIRAAVAGDGHYGLAYRIVRADGQVRWVGDRGQAVVAHDDVWLYGTVSDIHARKQLESDHARMEIELRMAQKLEAVGQLAAGIAHEINTPIQFVGDSLRFLQESFDDLETLLVGYRAACLDLTPVPARGELRRRLEQAEEDADFAYLQERVPAACARTLEGVDRVASIVRAMKEFAHPQTEQAPADLHQALVTTLTVARNEYKYVAEVHTDFGELPLVVCNLSDLNQVFLNLVVNAAHAIEDVERPGGELGTIRIGTERAGESVIIRIADSGHGIPEAIHTRIFDPFFTTKQVGRGSGQGLAIARSVVAKHGGTLEFETRSGAGTTFTIRLPIAGVTAPTGAVA